ncbi:hypothetical protein DPMN_133005 [Dreissena polymorpha]|uniref:Uncharacterized protein n=1 Tax=Dreissena polymorpha TaxID=45954 RepID=A0A9D4FUF0_DREPO|nr:hypothetical protein DPMN_133005 [Dreissena polymorpha]
MLVLITMINSTEKSQQRNKYETRAETSLRVHSVISSGGTEENSVIKRQSEASDNDYAVNKEDKSMFI